MFEGRQEEAGGEEGLHDSSLSGGPGEADRVIRELGLGSSLVMSRPVVCPPDVLTAFSLTALRGPPLSPPSNGIAGPYPAIVHSRACHHAGRKHSPGICSVCSPSTWAFCALSRHARHVANESMERGQRCSLR